MTVRLRRPPRKEWVPMAAGLVLMAVGGALLVGREGALSALALVAGVVLFYGVVIYRMATATKED